MNFEKNEYSGMSVGTGSNLITGLIGAIIGSIVGVVIWVIIYRIGFIAAIGGYAIAAGAMKGYDILGGCLDVKGLFTSIIVALAMVFVACYMSWVVEFHSALNEYEPWTLSEVAKELPNIIEYFDCKGDFIGDLVMGYILSIVGAGSMVANKFKVS